jgi:hypothetical protein
VQELMEETPGWEKTLTIRKFMRFILIFIAILNCLDSSGQDCVDAKYLRSIVYLKSDTSLNKAIQKAFYYELDSTQHIKEFRLGKQIWYLPLSFFQHQLLKNNYGIDSNLIISEALFDTKYYFDSYECVDLEKLMPPSKSRIILTFSRPFERYLIAEMLDTKSGGPTRFKSGRSILLLFIFDNHGFIEKVLYKIVTYR